MSAESSLGRLLRSLRAGERHLLENDPRLGAESGFSLSSPDFADGDAMPRRCAGAGVGVGVGDNLSPALQWSGVPAAAADLALVVQDPDAPLPWPITHLIAFGLDPSAGPPPKARSRLETAANSISAADLLAASAIKARDRCRGTGRTVMSSRCSRWRCRCILTLPPKLAALAAEMAGLVLGRARLTGRYERF